MKMKTKFFGLSAKLALAVLTISGALFTSCYESVDGDTPVPYKPLDPVYYISGTVTNLSTGAPLTTATVTVNGENVTLSSGGIYLFSKAIVGENTVTVKATGFNEDATATRKVTIEAIQPGQTVTYVVDVALAPNATPEPPAPFNPDDVKITIDVTKDITTTPTSKKLDKNSDPSLDLSTGVSSLSFMRSFKVTTGATVIKQDANDYTTAPADVQNVVNTYLGALFGYFGVAGSIEVPYTIVLPPLSKLSYVEVLYQTTQSKYTITYDGKTYYAVVKGVSNCFFSTKYEYTGHAHAHGSQDHGNAINAGGGIITPEN